MVIITWSNEYNENAIHQAGWFIPVGWSLGENDETAIRVVPLRYSKYNLA